MVNFTAPKRMMNNDKLIVLELSDGFSVPLTGANKTIYVDTVKLVMVCNRWLIVRPR